MRFGLGCVLLALNLLIAFPLLADAGPGDQKGLRPVRVSILSENAVLDTGQARGFFAAEGLAVDVTINPNSPAQYRGLGDGTWQMAVGSFDNVLAWSNREGA